MKQVVMTLYRSFVCCSSDSCTLRKLCTNHETAGDYRSEYGVQPELQGITVDAAGNGTMYCKTYSITYQVDYDSVNDPSLVTYGECVTIDDVDPQLPLF